MPSRVRPVRFPEDEDAVVVAAAAAAGVTVNRWVRRACREAAALERAVAAQDEGLGAGSLAAGKAGITGTAELPRTSPPARPFTPDFRPVSKKKGRR